MNDIEIMDIAIAEALDHPIFADNEVSRNDQTMLTKITGFNYRLKIVTRQTRPVSLHLELEPIGNCREPLRREIVADAGACDPVEIENFVFLFLENR